MPRQCYRQIGAAFSRFLNDEAGATALEYGFLIALVSIVLISALQSFGSTLIGVFLPIGDELSNSVS